MKKLAVIIMSILMVFSITACGGKESKDPIKAVAEVYGLDLKSTDEQEMSTERATKDKLSSAKHDFFKDTMMFEGTELENLTYDDIKAELGVDASYYYFEDALVEKQCFVWMAESKDASKLLISFTDGKLYGLGSANLS